MNSSMKIWIVAIIVLFLSGCASGPQPERISIEATSKPIKTIALLEIDELPEYLALNMSGAPALFGLIGGLVAGNSIEKNSKALTESFKSQDLELGGPLTDLIENKLKQKGYEVTRLANAREVTGTIVNDYKKIPTDADAIFDVIINISGYVDRGVGKPYKPIVNSRGQLVSTSDYEIKYLNVVNYGYKLVDEKWVHIPQSDAVEFADFEALIASPDIATRALIQGLEPIATELTKEL